MLGELFFQDVSCNSGEILFSKMTKVASPTLARTLITGEAEASISDKLEARCGRHADQTFAE